MRNKINICLIIIIIFSFIVPVKGDEQFNFDVTQIEIIDNGNRFIGKNKGVITTNNGVIIKANEFEYNKKLNVLNASGNVEVHDEVNDYLIFSKNITYNKDKELITTKGKSKAISQRDDVVITANEFEYNKKLNVLNASGNVEVHDEVNDYLIFSKNITYNKDKELITTKGKSKAISQRDDVVITAKNFEYFQALSIVTAYEKVFIQDNKRGYNLNSDYIKYLFNDGMVFAKGNAKILNLNDRTSVHAEKLEYDVQKNIIKAKKDVLLENKKKIYKVFSNELIYYKNNQKFITKGKTSAEIKLIYKVESSDVTFLQNSMEIFSDQKTSIKDNYNAYNASRFRYLIEEELLKGEDIIIISNYKKPQNDKFYLNNAFLDLKNNNFTAGKTKIEVSKDAFDNVENDPRIVGTSSKKNDEITIINKGIFTSCKKNDDCPPWSIEASKIKHDQDKKEMIYENAVLKVYNVPVLYFPKFFHPDPTVKRRSGILQPTLNNSNILGNSLIVPYYHVFSDQSDFTIAPTFFDTDTKMVQNEFRKVGNNSNILINFGHKRDYRSSSQNKKKNTNYIFSDMNFNLNLENFNTSTLDVGFEKITNDTFLKVFDTNLVDAATSLKPENFNVMKSELKLSLDHEKYNLTTGVEAYENLQENNNDRYEYVLPYFNLDKTIIPNSLDGSITLNSNGSNVLNNTNQLLTKITNNLSFSSLDYFTENGFKNNYNINLKNLNSVGENVNGYKSSPRSELSSIFEVNSILPLKKDTKISTNYLTPKLSLRFNPSDMKNHNNTSALINTGNIFSIDRFGLSDSYESGKSITLGIDYRSETLDEMNKYFEMKLATVYRDKEENFIPSKSTLNKKSSNIFGSLSTNVIENLSLDYNFALDNGLEEIEYNDVSATISFNKFSSKINFVKEMNEMGDESFLKNTTSYNFGENNTISFNTRRNRKINLTEFYDLVYEYKNDCLVAGLKYKKSYYEDRDLKPTEDLLFTVTFIPLTTFEQKVDQLK